MNRVEHFFNVYAYDFDAIYGTESTLLNKIINPIFRKSMRLRFEKTLLYCHPVRNKTVLDIGCGPGHYVIALAQMGAERVVGIDFAEEMIRIAREKVASHGLLERCDLLVEDIYHYRPTERFDFSVVMGVMDYIDTPEEMIKKVISMTKEKAFFSFPNSSGILALQRRFRYLKRCPLFMYNKDQLKSLFNTFIPNEYQIEKISRDYFVTLSINRH